ncbi:tRNA (adenosine(37)-N6)-threonylcarbamoyltransferase complex transferase subunit TsaD [Halocola ammonii]
MSNQEKDIYILAIESSCDDTSAAVFCNDRLLSNEVATQAIHKKYGGVVPELASRAHQKNIVPVVDIALKNAGVDRSQIGAMAFTRGPGLLGSLLVGVSFAKSFALARNIPLLEVNHMQAHILAHFIKDEDEKDAPEFPFLCLTVSGGHTQIVKVNSHLDMELIGHTIDDAAGEAFDKGAKILGLPYPGGPHVDKRAREGDPEKFAFTIPNVPGLDFSFSGLKTSLLYFIRDNEKENPNFLEENLNDICASYQQAIVTFLLQKLKRAARETGVKNICLAGGVSANSNLRNQLTELGESQGWKVFIPRFEYCTDNAAMIGIAGYFKYLKGEFASQDITPAARLSI